MFEVSDMSNFNKVRPTQMLIQDHWLSLFGKNREFHVHLDFRRWIAPPDILNQATRQDSWQMVLRWAENMKNGGNEIRIRIFGGNMKNGWNEIQIRIFPPTTAAVAARCQMIVSVLNCNQLRHTSTRVVFLLHT